MTGRLPEWLAQWLGIAIPPWRRDPQGFYFGGNDMVLSPLGLFRFGEVHRLGGLWNGARVLSERWIKEAWTPRTMSPYSGDDYGYGWFISNAGGQKLQRLTRGRVRVARDLVLRHLDDR